MGPSQSPPSPWSIASLVLFAFALLVLAAMWFGLPHKVGGEDPGSAAGLLFVIIVGLLTASAATVLGILTGWVGVTRSSSRLEFAWAGLALNGALTFLAAVIATWGFLAILIFMVALLYAAWRFVKRLIGQPWPVSLPTGFWPGWLTGCSCAVVVCTGLYALWRSWLGPTP